MSEAATASDTAAAIAALRAATETALEAALPPETAWPETIHKAVRYSLFAGGKRIRPVLVLAAGEAVGAPRAELLPLEESLRLYEQGIRLSRLCHGKLEEAEGRIEVLMKDARGEPVTDASGRPIWYNLMTQRVYFTCAPGG